MDNWLILWKYLLMGAVSLFAVLALVITVGGFFDVKALFRSVDAQHKEAKHESRDGNHP